MLGDVGPWQAPFHIYPASKGFGRETKARRTYSWETAFSIKLSGWFQGGYSLVQIPPFDLVVSPWVHAQSPPKVDHLLFNLSKWVVSKPGHNLLEKLITTHNQAYGRLRTTSADRSFK